jgi:hypothetical protein
VECPILNLENIIVRNLKPHVASHILPQFSFYGFSFSNRGNIRVNTSSLTLTTLITEPRAADKCQEVLTLNDNSVSPAAGMRRNLRTH